MHCEGNNFRHQRAAHGPHLVRSANARACVRGMDYRASRFHGCARANLPPTEKPCARDDQGSLPAT